MSIGLALLIIAFVVGLLFYSPVLRWIVGGLLVAVLAFGLAIHNHESKQAAAELLEQAKSACNSGPAWLFGKLSPSTEIRAAT
jgi:hypothetical protein